MEASPKRSTMTYTHRAALASGRASALAVRRYLETLEKTKPRRGRHASTDEFTQQLAAIERSLASTDLMTHLHLLQERKILKGRLVEATKSQDFARLEEAFISVAREYGKRKGIDYATWREVGVPATVLRQAGVGRARA